MNQGTERTDLGLRLGVFPQATSNTGGNGEICRLASRLGSKFGTFLCQVLPGDLRGGGEPESLFFSHGKQMLGQVTLETPLRKKKTTCNT